jgi:hypothetical protein
MPKKPEKYQGIPHSRLTQSRFTTNQLFVGSVENIISGAKIRHSQDIFVCFYIEKNISFFTKLYVST